MSQTSGTRLVFVAERISSGYQGSIASSLSTHLGIAASRDMRPCNRTVQGKVDVRRTIRTICNGDNHVNHAAASIGFRPFVCGSLGLGTNPLATTLTSIGSSVVALEAIRSGSERAEAVDARPSRGGVLVPTPWDSGYGKSASKDVSCTSTAR